MRFKSASNQFTVYAISGTHTISFAIDTEQKHCNGLLGFAVERQDVTEDEKYFMKGFKVFKETVPDPKTGEFYSSHEQPIQAFLWEDFTAKTGHEYVYNFYPVSGKPKNLSYGAPASIEVKTEKDYDPEAAHDIFFNRGVASSQAYAREFGNKRPEDTEDPQKTFRWLSRGLEEAILSFIQTAKDGTYGLRGCFYEFHHLPVLQEFKKAIARTVDVKIIYDAKDNASVDKKTGKKIDAFPKVVNEEAIRISGLQDCVTPREANKSYIAHNKFIVLLKDNEPVEVWTGSTNISEGGIFGQTNVGHRIKDKQVAANFLKYWGNLLEDPTGKTLKTESEAIQEDVAPKDITDPLLTIFSPRHKETMLVTYAMLMDSAESVSCITLAFGANAYIKELLDKDTEKGHLTFIMLEKDDIGISDFVSDHNVVKAVGSRLEDLLYQWAGEKTTGQLGLNQHVMYVHSKFLLVDPLGQNPLTVSGSANFSAPSTTNNDENMVIINGDRRTADIYFTEFMRIFNHYYFRFVTKKLREKGKDPKANPAFLLPNDSWTEKYFKYGSLNAKKIAMFRKMQGIQTAAESSA